MTFNMPGWSEFNLNQSFLVIWVLIIIWPMNFKLKSPIFFVAVYTFFYLWNDDHLLSNKNSLFNNYGIKSFALFPNATFAWLPVLISFSYYSCRISLKVPICRVKIIHNTNVPYLNDIKIHIKLRRKTEIII